MFNRLFKQKNTIAKDLYASALENTRLEVFYREYSVPDSFDGRFDLLLLHIFIILRRIKGQDNYDELSQDLFNVMFKDMDQTLREMGIGDVGIPKHMKKMMLAFNGRMHAYQEAVSSAKALRGVVARNLYAMELGDDALDENDLDYICAFMRSNLDSYKNIGKFVMLENKNAG